MGHLGGIRPGSWQVPEILAGSKQINFTRAVEWSDSECSLSPPGWDASPLQGYPLTLNFPFVIHTPTIPPKSSWDTGNELYHLSLMPPNQNCVFSNKKGKNHQIINIESQGRGELASCPNSFVWDCRQGGTVKKCFVQEHNVVSLSRVQTQTAQFGDKHTNHETTSFCFWWTLQCLPIFWHSNILTNKNAWSHHTSLGTYI